MSVYRAICIQEKLSNFSICFPSIKHKIRTHYIMVKRIEKLVSGHKLRPMMSDQSDDQILTVIDCTNAHYGACDDGLDDGKLHETELQALGWIDRCSRAM